MTRRCPRLFPAEGMPPAASAGGWGSQISAATLEDEVKSLKLDIDNGILDLNGTSNTVRFLNGDSAGRITYLDPADSNSDRLDSAAFVVKRSGGTDTASYSLPSWPRAELLESRNLSVSSRSLAASVPVTRIFMGCSLALKCFGVQSTVTSGIGMTKRPPQSPI